MKNLIEGMVLIWGKGQEQYKQILIERLERVHGETIKVSYSLDAYQAEHEIHWTNLIDSWFCCHAEQIDIDLGKLVLNKIRLFLELGEWKVGVRNRDFEILTDDESEKLFAQTKNNLSGLIEREYAFVLWFGLPGQAPLMNWVLDATDHVPDWRTFWNGLDWPFWQALGLSDSQLTWMFGECGMEEPEREYSRVVEKCPIKLSVNDTDAELEKKIQKLAIATFTQKT